MILDAEAVQTLTDAAMPSEAFDTLIAVEIEAAA
jgi:hypothetical protein